MMNHLPSEPERSKVVVRLDDSASPTDKLLRISPISLCVIPTLLVWAALTLSAALAIVWISRTIPGDARHWAIASSISSAALAGAIWHLTCAISRIRALRKLTAAPPPDAAAAKNPPLRTAQCGSDPERVEGLFDSDHVGMAVTEYDGRVLEANNQYLQMLGFTREELIAGTVRWDSVTAPDYRPADLRAREQLHTTGYCAPYQKEYLRRDGTRVAALICIAHFLRSPDQLITIAMDVSDRRHADATVLRQQAELAHLSRVASVGEMASSLAHEINQPLAAIVNYLGAAITILDHTPRVEDNTPNAARPKTLLSQPSSSAMLREAVRCASEQAQRAGQIIQRLRRFVRRGDHVDYGPIDLNATLIEAVRLVEPQLLRGQTQVQLELTPNLPLANGDAVEVQQVLVNLLQNANDALTDLPPDRRTVVVRSTFDGPETLRVSVIDSGMGISPDVLPRLFEAFLTTRPQGLGLGLAISRTIIENHGGRLTGENRPEGGALFSFTLCLHP